MAFRKRRGIQLVGRGRGLLCAGALLAAAQMVPAQQRMVGGNLIVKRRTSPSQACITPPSGLVGWWPGDSNANDVVGGNNPSAVNAVTLVPGEVQDGFSFGPDGYIEIPESSNLENQQFTWIAWVSPNGPGPLNDRNGSVIVNQVTNGSDFIQLSWSASSQQFVFVFGDNSTEFILSSDTFSPGAFYLVAGTYDGNVFQLFVNGVLEGSLAEAKTVAYSSAGWQIGGNLSTNQFARTWNGVIDEVQAFNRPLAQSEIQAIFNAASAGECKYASASGGAITVNSTDVIYSAGSSSALGSGTLPGYIALSGATSVTFSSVTGSIANSDGNACGSSAGCIVLNDGSGNNPNDPDGVGAAPPTSSNTGAGSLSGITAPGAGYLTGVFVTADGPAGPAPAPLDFTTGSGTAFTSLSPLIDQVFFIGDGLTGDNSGTLQVFNVPQGAVSLYLGISDACAYNGPPGCYGDNLGTYSVTYALSTASGSGPAISSGGVVSASDFGEFTSVSPGSWIEIYGSNLAVDTRSWTGADFEGVNAPTSLDGTSVTIGGQPAFVDFISPGQVNALVPSNVATGMQPLTVTVGNLTSAAYSVNVNPVEPGLDAPPSFNIGGVQYAVAVFADGTYALPAGAIPGLASRPAQAGDEIVLYGIGFGPVSPDIPAGQLVEQANSLASSFDLAVGGVPVESIPYFGLAPNYTGLYQFNIVVPSNASSGAIPLTLSVGSVAGTQTLYLAVGN
jgi:uncharacterized protein (TIGR03437 family)